MVVDRESHFSIILLLKIGENREELTIACSAIFSESVEIIF